MSIKLRMFFLVFIFVTIIFCLTYALSEISSNTTNKVRIKYRKIFEETLPGEGIASDYWEVKRLLVRAFDLKHKNTKNGIVLAGTKLYIFTANGTLLTKSSEDFKKNVQQMRIAKLSKEGYYDTIVVSQDYCGPKFTIFDRTGIHLSTISGIRDRPTFFVKDLDGDGTDEAVIGNRAYYSKDGGNTWELLWQNNEFSQELILGSDFDLERGFCAIDKNDNKENILAVNGAGKVLFRTNIPRPSVEVPLATGDLDGDSIKNEVAALGDSKNTKIYILDRNGNVINVIPLAIGSGIPFSASKVICGRLIGNSNANEIVVGGLQGIIAYDAKGYKLWDFDAGGHDIWEGQGSYMQGIYHLFISDLDSDGNAELIAGAANKILIFSNRGELIDEISVDGIIKGYAASGQCDNPSMDIADINNDGLQEIIAATTAGKLYIFAIQ